MTIVDAPCSIVGGVDTHLDVHVAAALDPIGGLLGVEEFAADAAGERVLLAWLRDLGDVTLVGVEGTGSYGAGLARYLRSVDIDVVEVDRPNRQLRRLKGKSDSVDAVAAARAAQSGSAAGRAKSRDGSVEAIRALLVAKRSLQSQRIQTLNQMRHLTFTAPEPLRGRFRGLSTKQLVRHGAGLRPGRTRDLVIRATKTSLHELGRRAQYLRSEQLRLDREIRPLVTETAPELVTALGVGIDTAATLLVVAGDNPQRVRTEAAWARLCGVAPIEASSGKLTRHRLDRGGDRRANAALWRIAFTRMRHDPRTRDYVANRRARGCSTPEIMRCLKRYIAREIYKLLPRHAARTA